MIRQLYAGYAALPEAHEPSGAPPAERAAVVELWLVAQEPAGGKPEDSASFTTIPSGALLGVARFPAKYKDRRGQTVKPGVYTMRYGLFPVNGDHQGVAPQRDFLILSPAASTPI